MTERTHTDRVRRLGPSGEDYSALSATLFGTATIATGDGSATVTVGADYNGAPVLCTFAVADATAIVITSAVVSGGTLTITAKVAATADTGVHYAVFL